MKLVMSLQITLFVKVECCQFIIGIVEVATLLYHFLPADVATVLDYVNHSCTAVEEFSLLGKPLNPFLDDLLRGLLWFLHRRQLWCMFTIHQGISENIFSALLNHVKIRKVLLSALVMHLL